MCKGEERKNLLTRKAEKEKKKLFSFNFFSPNLPRKSKINGNGFNFVEVFNVNFITGEGRKSSSSKNIQTSL